MDNAKLTTKSQEALSQAVRRAAAGGHAQVEPVHLLLALLEQTDGTAVPLLEAAGADVASVRSRAEQAIARMPRASGSTVAAPNLSRPVLAVLSGASEQAGKLGDGYVATEHLVVALAQHGADVAGWLREAGATPDALLGAFTAIRGTRRVTSEDPESTYQALEKYLSLIHI